MLAGLVPQLRQRLSSAASAAARASRAGNESRETRVQPPPRGRDRRRPRARLQALGLRSGEYSHRLAAEIVAALVRGSKHWDYDRVSAATASRQRSYPHPRARLQALQRQDQMPLVIYLIADAFCVCRLQVNDMWSWLTPLIKTAITNMSVECQCDWGTAFATSSVRTLLYYTQCQSSLLDS